MQISINEKATQEEIDKAKGLVLDFTGYHFKCVELPYQVSSNGMIHFSTVSKLKVVSIASIDSIGEVHRQCNLAEVKALNLKDTEPIPETHSKTLVLYDGHGLKEDRENPIFNNLICTKDGFIHPHLTISKNPSNVELLDIFKVDQFNELDKLHIVDFEHKNYESTGLNKTRRYFLLYSLVMEKDFDVSDKDLDKEGKLDTTDRKKAKINQLKEIMKEFFSDAMQTYL